MHNPHYSAARHYNASWGVPALSQAEGWLSVNPLSDKYPSHSAYNYCMNNPVMLVDPDGRDTSFATTANRQFVLQFVNPESPNYDRKFAKKFNRLAKSEKTYHFQSFEYKLEGPFKAGWTGKDPKDGAVLIFFTIGDNPNIPKLGMSEFSALWEETFHAWEYDKGRLDFDRPTATNEARAWKFAANAPGVQDKLPYFDHESGKNHMDYTPIFRIRNAGVSQVAHWLKFGMQAKYENGKGFMGMGIEENGKNVKGIYYNLPLK